MKPLRSEQVILLGGCVPVKRMMSERNVCEVQFRDELNNSSSHLLGNLSNCVICAPENFSGDFNEISVSLPYRGTTVSFIRSEVRLRIVNLDGK